MLMTMFPCFLVLEELRRCHCNMSSLCLERASGNYDVNATTLRVSVVSLELGGLEGVRNFSMSPTFYYSFFSSHIFFFNLHVLERKEYNDFSGQRAHVISALCARVRFIIILLKRPLFILQQPQE